MHKPPKKSHSSQDSEVLLLPKKPLHTAQGLCYYAIETALEIEQTKKMVVGREVILYRSEEKVCSS